MIEFLRTSKISSKIEDIIVLAQKEIILITPFLQLSRILLERLIERNDDGIKIIFIYKEGKVNESQLFQLKKLSNIEIRSLQNLHAKCYVNESRGIVTSMNLYEFSEKNNREMGISFTNSENRELFFEVNQEVISIIKASKLEYPINSTNVSTLDNRTSSNSQNPLPTNNKSSFNERMIEELRSFYPDLSFVYKTEYDIIECSSFTENFLLSLEPKETYFRIDFRLTGDYKNKAKNFRKLYSDRKNLEAQFPTNVVTWGNQMNRIKLDFKINYSPFASLDNIDKQQYINWIETAKKSFETRLGEKEDLHI